MAYDPPAEDATVPDFPMDAEASVHNEDVIGTEVIKDGGDTSTEDKARDEADAINIEAVVADLESRHAKLEEEYETYKGKLELQTAELSEAKKQILALKEDKIQLEQEVVIAKREAQSGSADHQSLEQENKAFKERMDRKDAEADALREEISRLTKCNNDIKSSLSEMEVKSKLSNSEIAPLVHANQRLQTEIESISAHGKWLEDELRLRLDEYTKVKRTQSAQIVSFRNALDQAILEKEVEAARANSLERAEKLLQTKVDQLSKKLLLQEREQVDAEQAAEEELTAERRLIQLQKEQLDRLENKHDDVVREMEAMQAKASQALDESRKERQQRVERESEQLKIALEEQSTKYEMQLEDLSHQLKEEKRRRVDVEDRFLALPTGRATGGAPLFITDGSPEEEEAPLGLTDLSARLAQAQIELIAERTRRKKSELRFERVQADIEARAPLLLRQRQEYEFAMKRQDDYQNRLDDAIEENKMYRREAQDLRTELSRVQKSNHGLQQESAELAKQVQGLLMSRSGLEVHGDIPTSIEEIQSQNQRLLGEHRRLTSTVKELEEKLKSNSLRLTLEATEKELAILREDRRQQERLVSGIVQQRDLYRALLSKHDSKLLGTEQEEVTAIEMTKRQSERTKSLEKKTEDLDSELANTKGELDRVSRDKNIIAEQLSRNETLVVNFTKEVGTLRVELSGAKSESARSKAESAYYNERASRMEESLRRAREETEHMFNAKQELQRINNDLQNAVTNANLESAKSESGRRQLEQKLRLVESQAATSKAAEKRMVGENEQLRNELARQGGLLDSVRRIEASLAAKKDVETEKLKEDSERLAFQLSKQEAKHATETENLSSRIHELEARCLELESSCEKANAVLLASQSKFLSKQEDIQKLTTKCSTLATQLHALRKKYGETDDSSDVDVTLQDRIKALNSELEAAKAELETHKAASENYQNAAKASESTLAELSKKTQEFRLAQEEEIDRLQATISEVKKDNKAKDEIVAELTSDLMKVRGEQDGVVEELKNKVETLEKELENNGQDLEATKTQTGALKLELETVRGRETEAQNNYERELGQHAAARSELRQARSEAEEERRNRVAAEEKLHSLKNDSDNLRTQHAEEKTLFEEVLKNAEKRLKEAEAQNDVLHSQLQTLGEMAEREQAARVDAAAGQAGTDDATVGDSVEVKALRKTVSELREVIRYLRSEKEMIQAQVDSVKRNAERERTSASVYKRSLDEARAELEVLTNISTEMNTTDGRYVMELSEKLQSSEDQMKLLRDSNYLLRGEAEKLKKSLESLQAELEASKSSVLPLEKRQLHLEAEKAALETETASLKREVDSWKDRVHKLVSKFNQVDPEEHKQALSKIETLNTEAATLKAAKETAESESTRMRNIATKLTKEVAQQKKLVETQKKMLAQLSAQKESLASSKNIQATTERDQLKEKVAKVEKELNSVKTELDGANEINNKLRERLRQFQKMIKDLRQKEKSLAEQLALAQAHQPVDAGTADASSGPSSSQEGEFATKSSELIEKQGPTKSVLPATAFGETKVPGEVKTEAKPESTTEAPEPAPAQAKPRDELLRLPTGGFNFGPNESAAQSQKTGTAPTSAASKLQTADSATIRRTTTLTASSEKPSAQSTGEAAVANPSATPSSPKPKTPVQVESKTVSPRRNSGTTKELSMKERLLEKKRLLQEKMERNKKLHQEASERIKTEEGPERAIKRAKMENEENSDVSREPIPTSSPPEIQALEPESKDNEESKEEGEDGEVAEPSVKKMKTTDIKFEEKIGVPAAAAVARDRISGFVAPGSSDSNPAPFGSSQAPVFASGSGATSVFASSTFGSSSDTKDSSGGGAFLNITPPGAQAAPPTFAFGNSSSITLPTPTLKTRTSAGSSPFGIFAPSSGSTSSPFAVFVSSAGVGFGLSAGGAKPLFTTQPAALAKTGEELKQVDEGEDGEVQTGDQAEV